MHDVAEALDNHLFLDPHGAVARDAAHVVAAEIQEHDVLGAFLGIGEELLGKRSVLLVGFAAAARARNGPDRNLAGLDLYHDLGRRADQAQVAEREVEHVWGGINHPEGAIDVERIGRRRRRQTLTQDDLKDVARVDVFLAPLDGAAELVLFEIAPEGKRDLAARRDVVAQLHDRRAQSLNGLVYAGDGALVRGAGTFLSDVRRADHEDRLV